MPRSITSVCFLTLFLVFGLLQNASSESVKCGDVLKITDVKGISFTGKLLRIAEDSISLGAQTHAKMNISEVYLYKRGRRVTIRNGIAIGLLVGGTTVMYAENVKHRYQKPDPWLFAWATMGCAAVGGLIGALVYSYEQIDTNALSGELDCRSRTGIHENAVVGLVIKVNL